LKLKASRALVIGSSVIAVAGGCASTGGSGGSGGAAASSTTASATTQRNLVTAQELAVAGDVDLYEALSKVRPTFLRSRIGGGTSGVRAPELTVYFDGLRMDEGLEHLRSLAARNILEVRFLEPQQANARFGGNNSGGALVVTTKK
jgi:hypothetical protein